MAKKKQPTGKDFEQKALQMERLREWYMDHLPMGCGTDYETQANLNALLEGMEIALEKARIISKVQRFKEEERAKQLAEAPLLADIYSED